MRLGRRQRAGTIGLRLCLCMEWPEEFCDERSPYESADCCTAARSGRLCRPALFGPVAVCGFDSPSGCAARQLVRARAFDHRAVRAGVAVGRPGCRARRSARIDATTRARGRPDPVRNRFRLGRGRPHRHQRPRRAGDRHRVRAVCVRPGGEGDHRRGHPQLRSRRAARGRSASIAAADRHRHVG